MRTNLLLGLGAWMALPGGGVTGLLAVSALSDGYFIGEPGLLYRKWPGQQTAQADAIRSAICSNSGHHRPTATLLPTGRC
jgi:hypothetical protein